MNRFQSLEQLRIARPCPARWEDMTGDEQVRFCGLCRKNVYNLSSMPREAALRLVQEREGQLCALLYRRSDGTVLTSDCPVGVRASAARFGRRLAAALAGFLLTLGGRYLTPEVGEKRTESLGSKPGARLSQQPSRLSPREMEALRSLGYLGPEGVAAAKLIPSRR